MYKYARSMFLAKYDNTFSSDGCKIAVKLQSPVYIMAVPCFDKLHNKDTFKKLKCYKFNFLNSWPSFSSSFSSRSTMPLYNPVICEPLSL